VSCGTTCVASFASGTAVTLTAAPAAGYSFGGWTGGGCTGTAPCTTTLSAATTVQASFTPLPVSGTQYIPLTLASGPVATAVPVRTGIPFPRGAITNLAHLRLESADGSREVPAQFDALSRWPDGSIKVALTHLVTDLGAARTYRIAYGSTVSRAALPRNVQITGTPSTEVVVDTGPVRFAVNNKGVLSKLWRDGNANGSFEASEQIIDAGDMFMVNAKNNLEYTASRAADAVVTVEENGPMRAVIKAQGSLTDSTGSTLIKYVVRYYASQGSDKVDIDATVVDDRLEPDVQRVGAELALAAKALGLRWHYLSDGEARYRFGGENSTVHGGVVSGEHHLLQTGMFNYVNGSFNGHTLAYSGAGTGARAPGWAALDTGGRHLSLMVRDFWQNFPNEISINGSTRMLTASLFPARSITGTADISPIIPSGTTYTRPNTFYFHRPGGAKTYQLRLAADATEQATATVVGLNNSFQRHNLDLMASLSWYTASGVFGDLSVGGSSTANTGYDAMLMRDIYEPSIERAEPRAANMYGWRDYGDRLRAGWTNVINGQRIPSFYNDTHVGSNNFFKQFLRSGDQRWFRLADISTRHFMDINVHHGPRNGYWVTGGPQPAGELSGSGHDNPDHESRNLHWGHAHVSGLSDAYLLTGDKRSHDVLMEIGAWWKFVSPHFFKTPFVATGARYTYREAERDYAWPLYVMNEYVRVTGDEQYHKDVAGNLANYLIQWWQTPMQHIGYNPATGVVSNAVIGINDASNGTGYWTMSRMDNYGPANLATGTNPWMAGPLVSNVIKFYEQDLQFAAAGKGSGVSHPLLKDMLFQGMNYIVKHGYDSTRRFFTYSETIRSYSGGDTHIVYGLAYLDRLYKQELAAGRIANPGWYDTQPLWGQIAARRYDEMNALAVGSYTQSYGFYGYEIVYPADFFKVMKDTLGR
jgi:hypothetical protein